MKITLRGVLKEVLRAVLSVLFIIGYIQVIPAFGVIGMVVYTLVVGAVAWKV